LWKTTLLLNFLLRRECLDYDDLIVFCKSLFQAGYRILKKAPKEQLPKEAVIGLFDNHDEIMQLNLSPIQLQEEMAKNQTGKSDTKCKFHESASDVLGPKGLSSERKNSMVFDD